MRREHAAVWCEGVADATVEGLVLHGYGGCKEEVVEVATALAQRLSARILVPDLPGHGDRSSEPLTRAGATEAVAAALGKLERPAFVLGHSLGGRLALASGVRVVVGLSVPGEAVFDGTPREMARVLRSKRVTEAERYSGLREILEATARPAPESLMLVAERDLGSVARLVDAWRSHPGVDTHEIASADHLSIVDALETRERAIDWLSGRLP